MPPIDASKIPVRKGHNDEDQFLLESVESSPMKDTMSEAIAAQITRLEILCAEQENMLQALNDVVARQDSELVGIKNELKLLTQQYQALKSDLPNQLDPAEKPPHY